ncbi:hypothetical protein CLAIMM_15125 [Cladophialophora immunda]|nr:hypothetical protein CLAIMM_15125 [Cladophialophora immunda]
MTMNLNLRPLSKEFKRTRNSTSETDQDGKEEEEEKWDEGNEEEEEEEQEDKDEDDESDEGDGGDEGDEYEDEEIQIEHPFKGEQQPENDVAGNESPLIMASDVQDEDLGVVSTPSPTSNPINDFDQISSILEATPQSSHEKEDIPMVDISSSWSPPSTLLPESTALNDPGVIDPLTVERLERINPEATMSEIARDIDDLIAIGCLHSKDIEWKTVRSEDSEHVLSSFRPGEWLNDDAVMETLYHLTSAHQGAHVVNSLDFGTAYDRLEPDRIRRRKSPSLVLIPVHLKPQPHWLLVRACFKDLRVVIHQKRPRYHQRLEKILSAIFLGSEGWTVEHKSVSQSPTPTRPHE